MSHAWASLADVLVLPALGLDQDGDAGRPTEAAVESAVAVVGGGRRGVIIPAPRTLN